MKHIEVKYMKRIMVFLAFLVLFPGSLYSKMYVDDRDYARAEITSIKHVVETVNEIKANVIKIHLTVLDGKHKGETKVAIFGGENDLPKELQYQEGDVVYIGISQSMEAGTTGYVSIYDYDNTVGIVILLVIMVGAIVAVGRLKGVMSLGALMVTILLVFFVLLPATLKGYPPLPIAVGIAILSVLLTIPLITGISKKTLGAVAGASLGIILAALLSFLFGAIMQLSGVVTNDMLMIFMASDVAIDLRGLVLSGMIIAALGAIMDIAISISSSTAEIYAANPNLTPAKAVSSVMNIGRDILGSMVNTLILAYVGSSLAMILWISMKMNPDVPLLMVLNYNPILSEIVKSAIGSIGMFLTIPITAYITVRLYYRKDNEK
jgi:uncharacterized membrane protein